METSGIESVLPIDHRTFYCPVGLGVLTEFEVPTELVAVAVTAILLANGTLLVVASVVLKGTVMANSPPNGSDDELLYQNPALCETSTEKVVVGKLKDDDKLLNCKLSLPNERVGE